MVGTIRQVEGESPDQSGRLYGRTSAADMLWGAVYDTLFSTRKAAWADCSSIVLTNAGVGDVANRIQGYGPSDPAANFRLLDQVSDRLFTPDVTQLRHPYIVTDDLTGRPVLMFGGGGVSPNNLSAANNGAILLASGNDAYGKAGNDDDMFGPGLGWSLAAKYRTGSKAEVTASGSTTFNGVTYTNIGGALLGNAAKASADQQTSLIVNIETSAGHPRMFNQSNVVTTGQWADVNANTADKAWHTLMCVSDRAAGSYAMYLDVDPTTGVAATQTIIASGVTVDVVGGNGGGKPVMGGQGAITGTGPGQGWLGAIAAWSPMQGPILGNANARLLMAKRLAEL